MNIDYVRENGSHGTLSVPDRFYVRPVSLTKPCDQCGGQGYIDARHFGDNGWHPCYRCGTTGALQPSYRGELTFENSLPPLPYDGTRVVLNSSFCPCGDSSSHIASESNYPLLARG